MILPRRVTFELAGPIAAIRPELDLLGEIVKHHSGNRDTGLIERVLCPTCGSQIGRTSSHDEEDGIHESAEHPTVCEAQYSWTVENHAVELSHGGFDQAALFDRSEDFDGNARWVAYREKEQVWQGIGTCNGTCPR
jgi:hypothetical protein